MQLNLKDGQLTLGSAYKLFVVGWIVSWGGFFLLFFGLFFAMGLAGAPMTFNGEVVTNNSDMLIQMIPMLVLMPIIVVFHAFLFGGIWLAGAAIYKMWKGLKVATTDTAG
jgi:hypothetical protein